MQKRDGKEGKNLEKRVRKLLNLIVKKGADVRAWSPVGWSPIYAAVNAKPAAERSAPMVEGNRNILEMLH